MHIVAVVRGLSYWAKIILCKICVDNDKKYNTNTCTKKKKKCYITNRVVCPLGGIL